MDFPGGSDSKVSAYNAEDLGSTPGREDLLEKEMATLSSILPWKMPWLEGPGGLQSTESQSQLCLSGFTFAFIAVCLFILASSFTPHLSPLVTTCFSTAVGSCCLGRSLYEFHLPKMHTDICLPRLLCS